MKKQHLFTLDLSLIQELHRKVGRGHRSSFVEKAVRDRLQKKEAFTLRDCDLKDLVMNIQSRIHKTHPALVLLLQELIE